VCVCVLARSDRVAGAGCFGATLMLEPELVGDCMRAVGDAAGKFCQLYICIHVAVIWGVLVIFGLVRGTQVKFTQYLCCDVLEMNTHS